MAPPKYLAAIVLLVLIALLGWNGVLELRAEEPRRAIVSMEMWLTGEYWVPRINGWSYYNKPPLFNWWMVLFFKLFGSCAEWVVRLPSLVAFLATAVLNYAIVRQFLAKEVAILSSLFLVTSADLLFYGTVNAGEIDLFFSALVYAQVMAIFVFSERRQILQLFLVSYLLAALGTLTKGPPSIAFQGLTLVPWLISGGNWRWLFSWKHIVGMVTYVLIVGGYFMVYAQYDDAVGFMTRLFKEASQRTGTEHPFWETIQQSVVFPFLLIQLLLPWSLLVIFFFRRDLWPRIRQRGLLRFSVIFILFNIPLYWFTADSRARYLYMFFPFFCILLAHFGASSTYVSDKKTIHLHKWKNRLEKFFLGMMVVGTLAFTAVPFYPLTAVLPGILWKSILIVVFGWVVTYGYWRFAERRMYLLVLFMLVLRLGFNFTYLPAAARHSDSMIYRQRIQQVLKITDSEPVYLTGAPYTFASDVSLGPLMLKNVELTSAPLIAYQIPYYLTKGNGHILRFDTALVSGRYYLAHQPVVLQQNMHESYRFPDQWLRKEVVLFKVE